MTIRYCDRCGAHVPPYEQYRITVWFENDPSPPDFPRIAGCLCQRCAIPALQLVAETHRALAEQCDRDEAVTAAYRDQKQRAERAEKALAECEAALDEAEKYIARGVTRADPRA